MVFIIVIQGLYEWRHGVASAKHEPMMIFYIIEFIPNLVFTSYFLRFSNYFPLYGFILSWFRKAKHKPEKNIEEVIHNTEGSISTLPLLWRITKRFKKCSNVNLINFFKKLIASSLRRKSLRKTTADFIAPHASSKHGISGAKIVSASTIVMLAQFGRTSR